MSFTGRIIEDYRSDELCNNVYTESGLSETIGVKESTCGATLHGNHAYMVLC